MEYWLPWKPEKDFYFKSGRGLNKMFYFIPSSEFNAYLKQIKAILSAVKKIIFFH